MTSCIKRTSAFVLSEIGRQYESISGDRVITEKQKQAKCLTILCFHLQKSHCTCIVFPCLAVTSSVFPNLVKYRLVYLPYEDMTVTVSRKQAVFLHLNETIGRLLQ